MDENQTNIIVKHSSSKKWLIICIIVAIIAVVAIDYWYIKQKEKLPQNTMDPRLAELLKLKESSNPITTTTAERITELNNLQKSSKSNSLSREEMINQLNNLSKQ